MHMTAPRIDRSSITHRRAEWIGTTGAAIVKARDEAIAVRQATADAEIVNLLAERAQLSLCEAETTKARDVLLAALEGVKAATQLVTEAERAKDRAGAQKTRAIAQIRGTLPPGAVADQAITAARAEYETQLPQLDAAVNAAHTRLAAALALVKDAERFVADAEANREAAGAQAARKERLIREALTTDCGHIQAECERRLAESWLQEKKRGGQ